MTKEQLKQELKPLHWSRREIGDREDIYAHSGIQCPWYSIYKLDGMYAVAIEDFDRRWRVGIAVDIKTIEEAKAIAWEDHVNYILQQFK